MKTAISLKSDISHKHRGIQLINRYCYKRNRDNELSLSRLLGHIRKLHKHGSNPYTTIIFKSGV